MFSSLCARQITLNSLLLWKCFYTFEVFCLSTKQKKQNNVTSVGLFSVCYGECEGKKPPTFALAVVSLENVEGCLLLEKGGDMSRLGPISLIKSVAILLCSAEPLLPLRRPFRVKLNMV